MEREARLGDWKRRAFCCLGRLPCTVLQRRVSKETGACRATLSSSEVNIQNIGRSFTHIVKISDRVDIEQCLEDTAAWKQRQFGDP